MLQFELLADRQGFIPTLAEWHYHEWAYLRPGDSIENCVSILRESSGRDELPITFVASSGAALLGSAMLIAHDMITLYTPNAQDFFSRLGWTILERTHYRDAEVTVISHTQVT